MSQHSLAIANEAGAAFRADVNSALQALASQSSGAAAPATMYAYQRWADTTNGVVKRRNAANAAWVLDGPLTETYMVARSSNTILAMADFGKSFRATSNFTQTLTAAATLGDGWWCQYRVESGVTITFDPNASEQIDGGTTKAVTGPASGLIICDATGFYTYGFGSTSVSAATLGTSAMASGAMINGTIVHSRAGNAETIAIKNLAGNDPSAGDPVYVIFRNVTPATGDYAVITLTAATSITINNTALMGATNAVAFRLWLVGFNDGGTFRLGVINCLSGTSIYPLGGFGIASSTTIGTGSDSAHVFYSGTGVTSKAYAVLGYSSWESGLAAVGVWDTAPTRVQLFGPGVLLPGLVVQSRLDSTAAFPTITSNIPLDDTIPQNGSEGTTVNSVAITPTSAANVLEMTADGWCGCAESVLGYFAQDATANALRAFGGYRSASAQGSKYAASHQMQAGTVSSTTLKWNMGSNTGNLYPNSDAGTRRFGGASTSNMAVRELMA